MLDRLRYLGAMGLRQLRWLAGDRSPFVATIKLTYRCNLACLHCPWSQRESAELTGAQWCERIGELRRRGVENFVLEGGEPTLREDLAEIVECARDGGRGRVVVSTNGTRDLAGLRPDRFLVSVDGLPESHDRIRGRGSYERMRRNVAGLEPPVHALVTVSRLNRHEIPALMDPLLPVVDGFWYSFAYDYGACEPIALEPGEMREVASQLASLAGRYPILNLPATLSRVGTRRPCHPWLLITVTPDGREVPGCMVEELERGDCDRCELSCHREISDLLHPRAYAFHLKRYLGRWPAGRTGGRPGPGGRRR
jgi:MoaA/NifB/PqqE/SkfB family radical SAM enzyme